MYYHLGCSGRWGWQGRYRLWGVCDAFDLASKVICREHLCQCSIKRSKSNSLPQCMWLWSTFSISHRKWFFANLYKGVLTGGLQSLSLFSSHSKIWFTVFKTFQWIPRTKQTVSVSNIICFIQQKFECSCLRLQFSLFLLFFFCF